MFKMPVCPHCSAQFYYKDILKAQKSKNITCPNCDKKIIVSKLRGRIVLVLIIFILSLILNLLLMYNMPVFSVIPLFVVTISVICIGILIHPFFTEFSKINNKKDRKIKK